MLSEDTKEAIEKNIKKAETVFCVTTSDEGLQISTQGTPANVGHSVFMALKELPEAEKFVVGLFLESALSDVLGNFKDVGKILDILKSNENETEEEEKE